MYLVLRTAERQDPDELRNDQYKTSSNLQARANLHQAYSSSPVNWFTWVFDQLGLTDGVQVLECGGGAGWLWEKNVERFPADFHVTLTDFSAGMVSEASQNLSHVADQFTFREVDIQQLPFDDDAFDVVVANHMLYHVPDLPKAMAEVRRVLRPDGRFIAATNGNGHMRDLKQVHEVFASFTGDEVEGIELPFRLENGAEILATQFADVELRRFEDRLAVTDAQAVIDYVLSSSQARESASAEAINQAHAFIQAKIDEHGAFNIQKEQGLFIAEGFSS